MNRERRDRILEAVLQVRPHEVRLTGTLFLIGLCVVGAFIVGRAVRDALFLAHGLRDLLPWMYIASALAVATVGFGYSRIADRFRRDRLTAGAALAFAGLFLVARAGLAGAGEWIYLALYVYVELVGALVIIQFWSLANDLFTARDAKRLFGTIGAGGTIANVVVGTAVGLLARTLGSENLLFACAALLVIASVLVLRLPYRAPSRPARAKPARGKTAGSRIFASRHLELVAALAVVTFFATTLVDFQFKTIVAKAFAKDALTAFFGNFYAVTGGVALIVQAFGTSRILSRFGVTAALAILPFCLGAGSVATLLFPALWAVSLSKGSEFAFRYTINDATTQLLYLPVPATARAGAKAFIDGVIKPGAIALSGALLIVYRRYGDGAIPPIAAVSAVACVAWTLIVWRLRGHYVRSLQDTLRRRRLDLDAAPRDDAAVSRVLLRALQSSNPRDVLTSLEMLAPGHPGAEDAVLPLLSHPVAEVRVAALRHLERSGSVPRGEQVQRLFQDPDPGVRAAAIGAFCASGRERAVRHVRGYLSDPEPRVRGTAIAGLVRYGGLDGVLSAAESLKALIVHAEPSMREEAARVLGAIGARNFFEPVLELMKDKVATVRRAAIAAAGQLLAPELIPPLLQRLGDEETAVEAAEALAAYGPGIEGALERILADRHEPAATRRAVPRVLGRLGTEQSIRIMSAHLEDTDVEVREALYRALSRALRRKRSFSADRKAVLAALDRELLSAYRAMAAAHGLGLDPPAGKPPHEGRAAAEALLATTLAEKARRGEAAVFALLGILYPDDEIELIYAGYQDATSAEAPRRRANAVELLDNVLERSLRNRLFPLLEDWPRARRLEAASAFFPLPTGDVQAHLRELLADDSAWVRACALFYLTFREDLATAPEPLLENLEHPSEIVREMAVVVAAARLKPLPRARALAKAADDPSPLVRERAALAQAAAKVG